MPMEPDLSQGGIRRRFHHIASDAEVMRAMRHKDVSIIEVPFLSQAFTVCRPLLTIVRSGSAGGDTFDIYGGWVYANDIAFLADRQELLELEANPVNKAFA